MKIFSFFSGAGLLDFGFEKAGFDITYVNEFHSPFLEAYKYSRQNFNTPEPQFGYFHGDIQNLLLGTEKHLLAEHIKTLRVSGHQVGFIGGPPCPDFSVAGKNRGRKGDKGKLSASYVELICQQKPDFFLFENVKGLWRTKQHRAFYEDLKRKLSDANYYMSERVVNSIEFGVPQDRDRIILVGFHKKLGNNFSSKEVSPNGMLVDGVFNWTENAIYPGRSAFENYTWPSRDDFKENSIKPAPDNIPLELTVEYWFRKNEVLCHPNTDHVFTPRAGLSKFKVIDEGDDSKKSYKRLHRWRYSPTAAYGNNEVHLHPYKARRISVAEALAIQSLPSGFALPPDMSLTNMFKTIGNGVPFLAAKGIAQSIQSFLGVSNENDCRQLSEGYRYTPQEQALQLRLLEKS